MIDRNGGDTDDHPTTVPVSATFSLARTCAPAWWAGDRLPDMGWDGAFTRVDHEGGTVVIRRATGSPGSLLVEGTGDAAGDIRWVRRVLGSRDLAPLGPDPTIVRLSARYPGVHPLASGSLYAGLLTSIIGQGVTVTAAATFQARLARSFAGAVVWGRQEGSRGFWPLPLAEDLSMADLASVRACGVTGRRAAALVAVARHAADGGLPSPEVALADPVSVEALLRDLPLVGPWTARSALLWGVGADDAYPPGDAALLRAARRAYDDDGLDQRGLEQVSEGWRPSRGRAARLLWVDLLGVPVVGETGPTGGVGPSGGAR